MITIPGVTIAAPFVALILVILAVTVTMIIAIINTSGWSKGYSQGNQSAKKQFDIDRPHLEKSAYDRGRASQKAASDREKAQVQQQYDALKGSYTALESKYKLLLDGNAKAVASLNERLETAEQKRTELERDNRTLSQLVKRAEEEAETRREDIIEAASLREDLDDAHDRIEELTRKNDELLQINHRLVEESKKALTEVRNNMQQHGITCRNEGRRDIYQIILEGLKDTDSKTFNEVISRLEV